MWAQQWVRVESRLFLCCLGVQFVACRKAGMKGPCLAGPMPKVTDLVMRAAAGDAGIDDDDGDIDDAAQQVHKLKTFYRVPL